MDFETLEELEQHFITGVTGYINPSLKEIELITCNIVSGITKKSWRYRYLQNIEDHGYKLRNCTIVESISGDVSTNYELWLELVSETPEGLPKLKSEFSGPDLYFPWSFSVVGSMNRNGSDGTEVTGASSYNSGIVYFKKSFARMMDWKYGLQNICACWSRCNEGDYIDVFVDAPLFDQYYQITGWVQVAQFAEYVTIFGSNSAGTWYPPDTSPNMSWVPQYCRIRFDFYKLKTDNSWLTNEPGPFVEVDFIGQRER